MKMGDITAAMPLRLATAPCNSPCADGPACLDITACTLGLAMPPSEPTAIAAYSIHAWVGEGVAQESERHEQESEHDGAAFADPWDDYAGQAPHDEHRHDADEGQ